MSGHTPGPWKADEIADKIWATDAKGTFPVCDIRGWGHLTGKGHGALGLSTNEAEAIQHANARLIAAAPDMLATLKRIAGGEFANASTLAVEGRWQEFATTLQTMARNMVVKAEGKP